MFPKKIEKGFCKPRRSHDLDQVACRSRNSKVGYTKNGSIVLFLYYLSRCALFLMLSHSSPRSVSSNATDTPLQLTLVLHPVAAFLLAN